MNTNTLLQKPINMLPSTKCHHVNMIKNVTSPQQNPVDNTTNLPKTSTKITTKTMQCTLHTVGMANAQTTSVTTEGEIFGKQTTEKSYQNKAEVTPKSYENLVMTSTSHVAISQEQAKMPVSPSYMSRETTTQKHEDM